MAGRLKVRYGQGVPEQAWLELQQLKALHIDVDIYSADSEHVACATFVTFARLAHCGCMFPHFVHPHISPPHTFPTRSAQ